MITNTFILSKNLVLALVDANIIDKKMTNDLASGQVELVTDPRSLFISSPLGLVHKHNRSWRRIHHLSHLAERLVNNNIPNGVREIRYSQFQDILQMVAWASRSCIILKRDVKNTFKNVPVVPY